MENKKPVLLVLPGPPLPLNQGFRHAAYNDLIQLSRIRDLHIIILRDFVYDFHPSQETLNHKELSTILGVKTVSFISVYPEWKKSSVQRLLYQIPAILIKGRLFSEAGSKILTQKITEMCRLYQCNEIHLGITEPIFIETFLDLQKEGNYQISFTAHNIEADQVLTRMRENLAEKKYLKSVVNRMEYKIRLSKELRACRQSKFVISMAYNDSVRFASRGVNVFFIPPFMHVVPRVKTLKAVPSNPALTVLGHLAFSAAGHGVDLFLDKVVPKVKNKVPNAVIRIIGKDASPKMIARCKQLGVLHKEYVENLDELWNEITVMASPLLVAKGIRIRILEAAYRGIPVVCTKEASTGFDTPDKFLCVADNFDMFADHCINLLTDASAYEDQQNKIYSYFEQHLSERAIQQKWERIWESSRFYQDEISKTLHKELRKTASTEYGY